LAIAYCARGLYDKAEPLYKRSIQITEKALGADHPDVAESLMPLARCYGRAGRNVEAEGLYKRAIQLLERPGVTVQPSLFSVLSQYGMFLRRTNREAEAKQIEARIGETIRKLAQPDPNP
jgi:tetratricopeptide (TPR) repeat protein